MKKVLCYAAVAVIVAIGLGSIGLTAYASNSNANSKDTISFTQAYIDIQTKNVGTLVQE